MIELGSRELSLEDVWAVAHGTAGRVTAPTTRAQRMAASRAVIEELVASDEIVYGVTTGFGDLASRRIAPPTSRRCSATCWSATPLALARRTRPKSCARCSLLRANALAQGHSGCRPELVDRLLDFLRMGIHPVVPQQGSVGASGDLAPLAHLALPLIGLGRRRSTAKSSTAQRQSTSRPRRR